MGVENDFSITFPMNLRSLVNCRAWHLNCAMLIAQAPPFSPPPSTRRPLLMPHFIMQHDGESRVKINLLSLKQLPSPADKEKPKAEWRAEWAERLQEPYGQLQLVSLMWRRAPGQRPMLGAVRPQPFLAKRSSISGNLPALSGWLSWDSKFWHESLLSQIICSIYIFRLAY